MEHDSGLVGTWRVDGMAPAGGTPVQGFRLESDGTGTIVSIGSDAPTDIGPSIKWSTSESTLRFSMGSAASDPAGDSYKYSIGADGKSLTVTPPLPALSGKFVKQ